MSGGRAIQDPAATRRIRQRKRDRQCQGDTGKSLPVTVRERWDVGGGVLCSHRQILRFWFHVHQTTLGPVLLSRPLLFARESILCVRDSRRVGLERGGSAAPGCSAGGRPRLLPNRFVRCRFLPRPATSGDPAAASSAPQLSAWDKAGGTLLLLCGEAAAAGAAPACPPRVKL